MLFQQPIKSRRIKLPQRVTDRIREIDDRKVKHLIAFLQPDKSIRIDHFDFWGVKGILIKLPEKRIMREEPGHFRIKIDQLNLLDTFVFQDLTNRQSISTTQHENMFWGLQELKAGMNQSFVIAV